MTAADRGGHAPLPSPAGPLAEPAAVRYGADGLAPIVVQDVADGRVLMVGYADAEAVAATLATGEVHFHSRSRGRLWRKGETSGAVLRLRGLDLDCDGDAILARVEPVGPTCHRDSRSCFDTDERPIAAGRPVAAERPAAAQAPAQGPAADQGFAWLEELWATIAARAASRPAGSYTVRLLDGGVDLVGRKVTEEATELLLAAKDDATAAAAGLGPSAPAREPLRAALAGEAADLLYHALVLLAERGLPPADVIAVLRRRHGD